MIIVDSTVSVSFFPKDLLLRNILPTAVTQGLIHFRCSMKPNVLRSRNADTYGGYPKLAVFCVLPYSKSELTMFINCDFAVVVNPS